MITQYQKWNKLDEYSQNKLIDFTTLSEAITHYDSITLKENEEHIILVQKDSNPGFVTFRHSNPAVKTLENMGREIEQ